jgi:hypothetical protein
MNEYIFFDATLRDRFLAFVAERGVTCQVRPDPIEGFVVGLPDDLPDDIAEAIENENEALMVEQQDMVDSTDQDGEGTLMGVAATLPDGQACQVLIPAEFGRRLVEHFNPEEIHDLVSVIAKGLLNPVKGPICRSL